MRVLKEQRVEIFEDTRAIYNSNEFLIKSIKDSKQNQKVILEKDIIETTEDKFTEDAKVIVSKSRTLEAASKYKNEKVAILNFASATNAGGGVIRGSSAQEECLCRCSTLYPCISDFSVTSKFHQKHKIYLKEGQMTAIYNDDCIFTPDVTVFKSDTDYPELLPENKWYSVDVISCAAPNLRFKPSNGMNPDSGERVKVTDKELLEIHIKRLTRILDIATANKNEVIILGAFGCGAFKNNPSVVAEASARVIKKYLKKFKVIEFAIYCSDRDTVKYDTFNRRLSKVGR